MKVMLLCSFVAVAAFGFAQVKESRDGWYSVDVAYPKFRNRSVTAGHANRWSTTREMAVASAFVARAKRELPEIKKMGSPMEYELLVNPSIRLDSAAVCSGFVTTYIYSGGAHGVTTYESLNIGPDGKQIPLQALFMKGVDAKAECSNALLEYFYRTKEGSDVQNGTWRHLTDEQAKDYVITPRGLLFLFGSYDLGSYAEGVYQVEIPFDRLQGLDRKGKYAELFVAKAPSLTDGTWVLDRIEYSNDEVLRPEPGGRYELTFASGRVTGMAGSNRLSGSYKSGGAGDLMLGPIAATRMADPEGSIAPRFLRDLGSSKRYFFKDGRLIILLPVDSGSMIFRLK